MPTFSILGKFRKAILSSVSLFFVTGSAASLLLVLGLLLLAFPCHVYAGQVTLAWNANTEIDLGGYKLYYGQASRNYTASVDVGNNTTYTLGGLGTGQTYYFAVTAYDRISLDESDFSNEAQVTIPGASPAAAFNASPTSGIAPLSVVFTDTSSGSITTWSWNFGDGLTTVGNSVSDQNPTHTYSGSGAYTVSLAVSGPDGSNTATKTNYITVAATPPAAAFNGSPTSGASPLSVAFTDTSTGSITTWSWNFGDGAASSLQNPSHTYSGSGTYTVSLTVSGPGGSNTATKTNYIAVAATPPAAAFNGSPTSGASPLSVAFTDTSTGSITTWSWNFGDGAASSLQNPSHTYSGSGTYTVSLTVSGPGGSNTTTKSKYISAAAAPVAGSVTTYEDAEDGTINGWSIFDNRPRKATISNEYDNERNSRVIQLTGSGTRNGYQLRNPDGTKWQNSTQFTVEWSMKYSEGFVVYIDVNTTKGQHYLYYTPVDQNLLGNKKYVHHGLGTLAMDGQWHTFVRDLQADLADAQPGVTILQVNGFLIRGSGRVDDIKLRFP